VKRHWRQLAEIVTEKTIVLPPDPGGNGAHANYRLTVMVPKRRYLSYLRERWWVVMVCIALSLAAALAYETVQPEKSSSFAELYASGEMQLNVGSFLNEESLTYYGTQIELLKSSRLQNAALEKIGYTPKPGEPSPVKIDVVQPMKTSILQLQVTSSDPTLPQSFLQALIDEYLAYKRETRRTTSDEIVQNLTDQVTEKENQLRVEQEKFAEFKRTNNVDVLDQDGRSAGLYLAELNMKLAQLKLDRELMAKGLNLVTNRPPSAAAVTNSAQTNAPNEAATDAPATTNQDNISNFESQLSSDEQWKSARLQLAEAQAEQERVRSLHGDGAARKLDDDVARLQTRVNVIEQQNLAEHNATLEGLDKRIAAMEASIPLWQTKVMNMNERLSQAELLKNNIQRESGYYEHLLSTLQNVDLGKNVQQERLSILQAPTPPQAVKRHLGLLIGLALVAGLFLSLGLVFCWYLLDDRFVSVRDIKDQFGETVLGLVPQIRVPRSKPQSALIEPGDTRAGYVESYRHLRSALLLSSQAEVRPQTLLFTGAAPAEGKTTVSLNLARLLARSGLRVVVVDGDAHTGGLTRLLNAGNQLGVLDFLRGEADAQAIIHPSGIEGLLFVPIGTRTEHAEGLFLRPQLADLMNVLRENRDFVIVDGAPILGSDDSALLVPHTDAVVLVTRPFYTHSRLVRQALDMLYQRQAKSVSFIHNRARADDLSGHYAMNGVASPAKNGKA